MADTPAIATFEHLIRRQSVQELVPFLLQLAKQDVVSVRLKTKQLYQELNEWRADRPQLSRCCFWPAWQRLSEQFAQARAISPTTDDTLRQVLDALLPALPDAPLPNLAKLLDTYADLLARTRQPAPEAVQDRLRTWQPVPSLKKTTSALLA